MLFVQLFGQLCEDSEMNMGNSYVDFLKCKYDYDFRSIIQRYNFSPSIINDDIDDEKMWMYIQDYLTPKDLRDCKLFCPEEIYEQYKNDSSLYLANEITIDNYMLYTGHRVIVLGDVNLQYSQFTQLPNIDFVRIHGSLILKGNYLKSLKSNLTSLSECIIDGDFDCSNNELKNLQGFPKSVGYSVYLENNKLKSLNGCVKKVRNNFNCSNNLLTSLKHCPKDIGGNLHCDHNKLTSLMYAPEKIHCNLSASYNEINTLKDCPKQIVGVFNCNYNELTSLVGDLESVGDEFYCMHNKLKSLEGLPSNVTSLHCDYNEIEELDENLPCFYDFSISYNKLKNLKNFPRVLHSFNITKNYINNFDGMPVDADIICEGPYAVQNVKVSNDLIDIVEKRRNKMKTLANFNKQFNKGVDYEKNDVYLKKIKQKLYTFQYNQWLENN